MAFKGSFLASHSISLALICARLLQLIPNQIIPIGVGEVIRIIGKCVTKMTKEYILESSGLLQVCTEHKSGSEAGVHKMNSSLVMEQPTTCC